MREIQTYDKAGQPVSLNIEPTDYGARVHVGEYVTLTMDDAELRVLIRALQAVRSG